jgi:hypothetical protein
MPMPPDPRIALTEGREVLHPALNAIKSPSHQLHDNAAQSDLRGQRSHILYRGLLAGKVPAPSVTGRSIYRGFHSWGFVAQGAEKWDL